MTAYLGSGPIGPLLFGATGMGICMALRSIARHRHALTPFERMRRALAADMRESEQA